VISDRSLLALPAGLVFGFVFPMLVASLPVVATLDFITAVRPLRNHAAQTA
jgi:hypothetical protein